MGHPGKVRTLKLLLKYFPSHGMSQEVLANMVAQCPHCQKIRLVWILDWFLCTEPYHRRIYMLPSDVILSQYPRPMT
jgi:hypothetical protein